MGSTHFLAPSALSALAFATAPGGTLQAVLLAFGGLHVGEHRIEQRKR